MVEKIYVDHLRKSYENADQLVSKISQNILNLDGLTGAKTRHFYNNLLNMDNVRYLEIGTWKGSSVCAAMFNNKAKVVCIDNWSECFGQPNPKSEFLHNFNRFKGENDASFIEGDCFTMDTSSLPKFNIYMYDGEHSEKSHQKALSHFYNCLDDVFIYVVDDWNFVDVRKGTREALHNLNLIPIYEKEVYNLSHQYPNFDYQGWFNGVYMAVLKKNNSI